MPDDPTTHTGEPTDACHRPGGCPLAWVGVVAMGVALIVTSVLTTTAGAQLPSTSPSPGDESAGGGGTAGTVVFFVVVALIIGTAITLFVRHRGNQRR